MDADSGNMPPHTEQEANMQLDNKEITKTIVRARPSDEIDRIIKVFGKAL